MGRDAYVRRCRFFKNDNRPTFINWYYAPEGAQFYDDFHVFVSYKSLREVINVDPECGELTNFRWRLTPGRPPYADITGDAVHGSYEDFAGLSVLALSDDGSYVPRGPAPSCDSRPALGFLGGEHSSAVLGGNEVVMGWVGGNVLRCPPDEGLLGLLGGEVAHPRSESFLGFFGGEVIPGPGSGLLGLLGGEVAHPRSESFLGLLGGEWCGPAPDRAYHASLGEEGAAELAGGLVLESSAVGGGDDRLGALDRPLAGGLVLDGAGTTVPGGGGGDDRTGTLDRPLAGGLVLDGAGTLGPVGDDRTGTLDGSLDGGLVLDGVGSAAHPDVLAALDGELAGGLVLDAAVAGGSEIDIPDLFNTGLGPGTLLRGAAGDDDPNWTVTVPGPTTGPAQVLVDPTGDWLDDADSFLSRWVGQADDGLGNPDETTTYATSFTMPGGADLPTLRILGRWAVDNSISDVRINGSSTGITTGASFGSWTNFTLLPGLWASGTNTIEIDVLQGPGTEGNFAGLRVEWARGAALLSRFGSLGGNLDGGLVLDGAGTVT